MEIGFASVACVLTNLDLFLQFVRTIVWQTSGSDGGILPSSFSLILFFFISISFPVLAAAAFVLHLTQIYDLGFDIWK